MNNTSVRICDVARTIESMAPVSIYLNGEEIWNDDFGTLDEYYNILEREDLVAFLMFEVVHFHHSIVFIRTK